MAVESIGLGDKYYEGWLEWEVQAAHRFLGQASGRGRHQNNEIQGNGMKWPGLLAHSSCVPVSPKLTESSPKR